MSQTEPAKVAVLWRGDHEARKSATPVNNRFYRVFEELTAIGIHAESAVYSDEIVDEVREQLLNVDGVLVWVEQYDRVLYLLDGHFKFSDYMRHRIRAVPATNPPDAPHPRAVLSRPQPTPSPGFPSYTFPRNRV